MSSRPSTRASTHGRRARRAALLLLAALAPATSSSCRRDASGEHEHESAGGKPPFSVDHSPSGETILLLEPEAIEAAGIETAPPEPAEIAAETTAYGTLVADPSRVGVVRSPFAGTVRARGDAAASWPALGARVAMGAPLGTLAPRLAPLTLAEVADAASRREQAHAEELATEAELSAARSALDRARKLNAADKGVADSVVEAARASVVGSEAKLAAAKASVAVFDRLASGREVAELDPIPFVAPIAGEVVEVYARPGEEVAAGAELLKIADFTELFADVRAPLGSDASRAARVRVTVAGGAVGASLDAEVAGPAPEGDLLAPVLRLRIRDPSGSLRPGLAVTATLASAAPAKSGFALPAAALLRHASRSWVFVETEPGRYVRRAVAVVRAKNGHVLVSSGLAATDRVVTVGAMALLSQEQLAAGGGEGE